MTYSTKQLNEFRKEALLKDIESSKEAVKIVTREKVSDWMKIHLDRLEQLSKEK
tara:strand:- start:3687 stop:3848 length:162 start_codon:yes stop_codon:yes gene_type:complete